MSPHFGLEQNQDHHPPDTVDPVTWEEVAEQKEWESE